MTIIGLSTKPLKEFERLRKCIANLKKTKALILKERQSELKTEHERMHAKFNLKGILDGQEVTVDTNRPLKSISDALNECGLGELMHSSENSMFFFY